MYKGMGIAAAGLILTMVAGASNAGWHPASGNTGLPAQVELGPRPFYLVDTMNDSALKDDLQKCASFSAAGYRKSDFSIGHRGAPLQFPEHTKESYVAGARMGAGILECDVTFTQDKELVCRHSQCDLHTTTNILAIPELAAKCSVPFTPAVKDGAGNVIEPAKAQCCTSDITLAEFRQLRGKMDAADSSASTVEQYMGGTADFRTDLYANTGTLMTHAESIELFKQLRVKMTPELKGASVAMPFDGFTQHDYAQKMIDEYKAAGVPARDVYAQSFNLDDVLYWIGNEPAFGKQAVFLDGRYPGADTPDLPVIANPADPSSYEPTMEQLAGMGVNIIAPPMWRLLADGGDKIVPSVYATAAREAGLDVITWTLERSAPAVKGLGWYYQTTEGIYETDGDYLMNTLDVLAQDVGILGIFSDWPATVTFYANCMRLR